MSWRSRRRRVAMRKITAYCKEMLVRIQTEGISEPTNSRGTRIMLNTSDETAKWESLEYPEPPSSNDLKIVYEPVI